MSEKETDIYFSINRKKLNICVFKNIDDSLIFINEENINFESITENTDFNILEKFLDSNIKKIEKKTNSFLNNIFLIIDTPETVSISISLMKKLDNKKIQNKDITHLIRDAKQQIVRAYSDLDIVHIIVKKYVINELDYTFIPKDINCNKISTEIEFICFPKNLIKKIEVLFNNFHISIDKIICSNYAKLTVDNRDEKNICQIGRQINNGFNKQEVVMVPKKIEKKGFFEKLFYIFE